MTRERGAALAVVLVVVGVWIAATAPILSRGDLDLGFTTQNAAWVSVLAWTWPTMLLVVGAAAARARWLATLAVVCAGLELLALGIILVVQVALGARIEFLTTTVTTLVAMLLALVAAVLALVGAGHRRGARIAGLVVAIVAVVALAIGDLTWSLATFAIHGLLDPGLMAAVLLAGLPRILLALGLTLVAVPGGVGRWVAASVLALSGLATLALTGVDVVEGDPDVVALAGRAALGLLAIAAGGVLVASRGRSTPATTVEPVPRSATAGLHLPPPAPGSRVDAPRQ